MKICTKYLCWHSPHIKKFLLVMKITTILLIVSIMQVSATSFAQKITFSQKDVTLERLFLEIKKQTGYTVFYSNAELDDARTLDVNFKDTPLEKVLVQSLKDQGLVFSMEHKMILVKKEEKTFLDLLSAIDVRGRILDEQKKPLPGATVKVKGSNQSTVTNERGEFYLPNVSDHAVLLIGYVGYTQQEVNASKNLGDIVLSLSDNKLEEVNVTVNTGYQSLSKERATGSFTQINNELLNRSVSTNVLDRLDGVTSGLIFNKQANKSGFGRSSSGGDPGISIRGRSTLFANTEPLIVLDNFPYDGDLNNINPNDIETVTILKDAAAASIWGVRAGNGVIVLTSKTGKLDQSPKVSFNSNISIAEKPDLFSVPQMTSKEFIEFEKFLFDNGNYDFFLDYIPNSVQSPAIDILESERKGNISQTMAQTKLEALSKVDNRNDYTKYFLRNVVNQQYALNVSGGSPANRYYISGGFDANRASEVSTSYKRFNLSVNDIYSFFKDRLNLTANILFTKSTSTSNPSPFSPGSSYPYEELVDENGNARSIIRDYRQATKDAVSNLGLLDWNYYPFNERLNNSNISKLTDYRIGLQLNYKLIPKLLDVSMNYQYQQGLTDQTITNDQNSYVSRLLINQFSQIDPQGTITYPVPLGSMVNFVNTDYKSNTGRIQFNYHQDFASKHQISAIAGTEIKDNNSFARANQLYGYHAATATSTQVDYFKDFAFPIADGVGRIPFNDNQSGSVDRFFSYFANSSYSYAQKYTFSASARKDESNLFGVNANQKGVPLYSLGLSWVISKENFYKLTFLPYFRFRLTDGYNGNLSKNLSAYTTASTSYVNPYYNVPTQTILNPPNPSLSWEKVHITNFGLDFSIKNNTVSGSFDYYRKYGMDLIGNSPVAPQTGLAQFTGNTADLLTKGVDLILNTINTRGRLFWTSNFLFNFVKDKVTDYKMQTGLNNLYISENFRNPFVGRPYSSLFAYSWAGLDALGNPQGILNGQVSEDYDAIVNSKDVKNLKYIGTSTPTVFGSLRNNFTFQSIELSFNIVYKFGYYFRRGSFSPESLSFQQADYESRWQIPGDESKTNVPAILYPFNSLRESFYKNSEILIENGNHIRLQDIRVSYSLKQKNWGVKNLKFYGYVSNLGILWRANKLGLDPDYVGQGLYLVPNSRSFAMGISADF